MHAQRPFRLPWIVLLVVVLLLPAPGAAHAGKSLPDATHVTVLPPDPGAVVAPEIQPTPSKTPPYKLEDALAQLAEAQQSANRAQLDAFAGNRYVDLATGTARVILQMAVSPDAHITAKAAREVVELPNGQRATIEHAPQVAISPELSAAIASTGAVYETAYKNNVQVSAPFGSLIALSELPGVTFVRLPFPATQAALPAPGPDAPQIGTQTTEGVAVTGADVWQAAGDQGAAVSLAVFDFGFTGWAARQTAGDLPSGGQLVLKDFSSSYSFTPDTAGDEHGTACAEIAYDMAPESTIYLYAWDTDVELGNAVDDLITNVSGKKVVTMSIGYVNAGPYDGTGSINDIVDSAQAAGIFWANSAGNNQKAHWSGVATQYLTGDTVTFGTSDVEGFGPTPGSAWNIPSGTPIQVFLEWNDWNASRTGNQNHVDYDLILKKWNGAAWQQVASSMTRQCNTAAPPTEAIGFKTTSVANPYYAITIQRYTSGACPNNFGHWLQLHSFLNAGASNLFWYVNECNSLMIPSDGDSAATVGAAFWNEDTVGPLYGLEPFSSQGPRNAAGGAAPGTAVNKPDVVAPDGVSTATYGASNGVSYASGGSGFWGTSGAAPHVAGLAATLWSGRPDLTLAQLRDAIQTHTVTKGDGGTCGGGTSAPNNRYGWGRIAPGALPVAGLWDGGGTTNNWTEAANWDTGAVPTSDTPIRFDATSTKDATVNGGVTAAALTLDTGYTGIVTLGGSLTVSGSLTLTAGTLDVSAGNYPLAIGGDFLRTGGTFIPHTGTITFNGAGTSYITGTTTFYNLAVADGLTLTTSSAVTVSGALTNAGWTQETQAVSGTGTLSYGLAGVSVDVNTAGDLTSLSVLRRDQSFSGAPPGILTGKYWIFTPIGTTYNVTLTLPQGGLADPSVCRNTGDWWDCARTSQTTTTVTRAGVAAFSTWAVGNAIQAAVAPDPVTITSDASSNAVLSWSHNTANTAGYQVWWSTDPYFVPGAAGSADAIVSTAPWTYTHVGTPGTNYYYIVRGINGAGQVSGDSNRTGKFVFPLEPGLP